MSPIPSPGDLAAANKPVTADELRRKYTALFDDPGTPDEGTPDEGTTDAGTTDATAAGSDCGESGGEAATPAVEKLEAAHEMLHDALSERNN